MAVFLAFQLLLTPILGISFLGILQQRRRIQEERAALARLMVWSKTSRRNWKVL